MQIDVPDGVLSFQQLGEGPVVLLVHGFPEDATAWRHQLPALAAAGYCAVALDVRGYGGSLRPSEIEAYRMVQLVADNVAVLQAIGADRAAIIGHDWGSPIAQASAMLRPDLFAAIGMLGVPFTPRGPNRPTEAFAQAGGPDEFYVSYFQEPGRAEAEIEHDVAGWLRGFTVGLDSAGPEAPGWFVIPEGSAIRDRLPTDAELPVWLPEDEFAARVATLSKHGFAGPLARYRNVDRDWEDLAAWDGVTITQPAIYIAGSADSSTVWLQDAIAHQADWLPGIDGVHRIEGAGHWVQQERPDEVNTLLIDWLTRHYPGA